MLTMRLRHNKCLRGKGNRLQRIRYRYKEALAHENRAYEDRTGCLSQHGVTEYLRRLRHPDTPAAQRRLQLQPERVVEAAHIMGATIHTAAADNMLKHRRGAPRKPGTHMRMSEQRSKVRTLEQAIPQKPTSLGPKQQRATQGCNVG